MTVSKDFGTGVCASWLFAIDARSNARSLALSHLVHRPSFLFAYQHRATTRNSTIDSCAALPRADYLRPASFQRGMRLDLYLNDLSSLNPGLYDSCNLSATPIDIPVIGKNILWQINVKICANSSWIYHRWIKPHHSRNEIYMIDGIFF